MSKPPFFLCLAALVGSCAQTTSQRDAWGTESGPSLRDPWMGESEPPPAPYHLQGMIGVTEVSDVDVDIDGAAEGDPPTLPMLGAAVQYPMVGQRHGDGMHMRLGIEAGATAGYDGKTELFLVNNGVAVVRSEDDLFVLDLFGGPYADLFFGEAMRLYAGAGPLIQYGSLDVEYPDGAGGEVELDDDGFGLGWHARAGLEVRLYADMFIGLGARFVDSEIGFGGGLGDFDYEALQVALTVTSGF